MSIEKNLYKEFVTELKLKIRNSQQRAILSANKELIILYWEIGKSILISQEKQGWGAKIIKQLSEDLKKEFPEIKGFSERNLKYMRKFSDTYRDFQFVQEVIAQIPWYHNITLMEKIKDDNKRKWYIEKTIENGWSRNVLLHQIEYQLYERSDSKKVTNFENTLPKVQSELAMQTLKDPYIFDFLSIEKDALEREIEKELVKHISSFLLELGAGFAFVGNQYHLEIANRDFYLDLLFYHIKLKCYVVIELKTGEFKPEYAGKMNFYLSAVDDSLKSEDDNPTIGIILCKEKNNIFAEYTLRDMNKPMGIAEYKYNDIIPENLQTKLPSIEDLEKKLRDEFEVVEK
ncbi:PDDEXK nuclease domain-containing protein [Haliovirga abyssi]|uniref:DUF1016 domain-containing protein n=1 Tax=Haliovirga abyssi TaxID=2996794 RepID=A0AAU9DA73_9FUSO|nr:PDDEXK nuclease domain-containing protein [Haliovirga abyssi]BDU51543.1 hypothetical protein HLVA_21120 [Haliovirga abyssi]